MNDPAPGGGPHAPARGLGDIQLRTSLRPGDIGRVVQLHGLLYSRECGYDHTFEAYVASPLAQFARNDSVHERIWLAERGDRLVGCIAIVAASPDVAQLRWFLVDPSERGAGLGRHLMDQAIAFSHAQGYHSIVLWTVAGLNAAAHLYRAAGFRKIAENPGHLWGRDVVEEQYELSPVPPSPHWSRGRRQA